MDIFKNLAVMSIAAIMLIACGGDNGSSAKDEDSSSSVADEEKSSSSTKNSSSSDKESSSSAKESSSSSVAKYVCDIYTLADALSCKCDENREGKLSYNYDSNVELVCIHDAELNKWGWVVKKEESSSSSAKSSSSTAKSSSSSSVILSSSSEGSSSSAKSSSSVASSSSAKSSSSTAKSSSSIASSSSAKSSSSSVKISSSSEYVPFDHSVFLSGVKYEDGVYRQFTDERNGRSYYYITITGKDTSGKANTVTVMAENLNIGEMVDGFDDQSDDAKIERYCYNDDTTYCDKYGGLYQWAEMMALPSECNTKSCADLIKEKHQGICPTGWRLQTYNDMYTIVNADGNNHGIEGVRSAHKFGGYNTTGYSLVGAGYLFNSSFRNVNKATYWYYPEELDELKVKSSFSLSSSTNLGFDNVYKTQGFSVRCVMVE